MISARGKVAVPSFRRKPLMWSPWKWLNTTVSTWAGRTRRRGNWPSRCRRWARRGPVSGVDQHELAAGLDHERREGHRKLVGRQETIRQRLLQGARRRIRHEAVERAVGHAVVDGGHQHVADLVAEEGGRLRLHGCCGVGAADQRGGSHGGEAGGEGQAARDGHDVSPIAPGACLIFRRVARVKPAPPPAPAGAAAAARPRAAAPPPVARSLRRTAAPPRRGHTARPRTRPAARRLGARRRTSS